MSETIKQKIERARKAFDEISDYTQEQVDKLIYEAGKIIYQNAAKLAEMAVNCLLYTSRPGNAIPGELEGQVEKSIRRMPWHWEPKKDVTSCEKLR